MRGVVVFASFAAVIAVAAPAQADPSPDTNFLTELKNAGITYQTPSVAIGVGKSECKLMDEGMPETEVIKDLEESNPAFKGDSPVQFTTIAVNAYCPQHAGELTPPPASS
ncbi:hypothetical protein AWC05_05070 [Mycobacterium florentinum]|uniref:DUF732 domain-containing protein n=1 Tax=Mycobacterium florentinum TaxID=292462 RepID=A0A1X1TU58_MYCFL|nr:DUF732 domain-containing protein [Mycobacterium florentinum]MCV7408397.1 DUF732 domain-containing protein [Mycobacterium florentinum]ORV47949.1 hypothetical protein AWC05_05070 [Mycobacterium florentinum]BBX78109.1 hypothetical protein MFLOJ_18960 [Mycobacterium florentinum]